MTENDPAVRDSNLVGIASKIFDCIAKSIECFFDIRAPVFLIEGVFKGIPAKVCFLLGEGKRGLSESLTGTRHSDGIGIFP